MNGLLAMLLYYTKMLTALLVMIFCLYLKDVYRVFLLLIIRHLEGEAKVFSTFSVNSRVNLSHVLMII